MKLKLCDFLHSAFCIHPSILSLPYHEIKEDRAAFPIKYQWKQGEILSVLAFMTIFVPSLTSLLDQVSTFQLIESILPSSLLYLPKNKRKAECCQFVIAICIMQRQVNAMQQMLDFMLIFKRSQIWQQIWSTRRWVSSKTALVHTTQSTVIILGWLVYSK